MLVLKEKDVFMSLGDELDLGVLFANVRSWSME